MELDKKTLAKLEQSSSLIPAVHLLLEWISIVAMIILCEYIDHFLFYLLTVVFIGTRFQGIGVLGHEFLHIWGSKKMNVFQWAFLYVFIAIPLRWPIKKYFKEHIDHHRFLNTDKDPDYVKHQGYDEFELPMPKWKLYRILLMDLSGLNFLWFTIVSKKMMNVMLILLSVALYFVYQPAFHYYTFYFLVPMATWFAFLTRLRLISEHYGVSDDALMGARTTEVNWLERVLLMPNNANYHLEHHLFPRVPYYKLGSLHNLLMKKPEYRQKAHITNGFFNILKECGI